MAVCVMCEPRILRDSKVVRLRPFPRAGRARVQEGSEVKWDTVLGEYVPSHRIRTVRVETDQDRIIATVIVAPGQKVKRGEVLGFYSYLFGLGYTEYVAPCDGEVISIGEKTGIISIREEPVPFVSHVCGTVREVDEAKGITIEAWGDLLEGVAGAGSGRSGCLYLATTGPSSKTYVGSGDPTWRGKVVVFGGPLTEQVLEACVRFRAAGVIGSSMTRRTYLWYASLVRSLTWDEYLARYWSRELGHKEPPASPLEVVPSLVITEGFGMYPMRDSVFRLLTTREGQMVHLDGGDHGSTPGVLIPRDKTGRFEGAQPNFDFPSVEGHTPLARLEIGSRVRILGLLPSRAEGTVVSFEPTGSLYPHDVSLQHVVVRLASGETLTVPFTNVLAVR